MSEKTVQEAEVRETPTAQEVPTAKTGPELTVNDLSQLRQIIDVASQRGAFKPNEMVTVGTIYNKLDTFLTAVSKQQPQGD